jgi:hypothetical protein
MKNDRVVGVVLVIIALGTGLLIGRGFDAMPEVTPPVGPEVFRSWFWSHRSIDLAVQVGLIFAGALGVAAVLPAGDEDL